MRLTYPKPKNEQDFEELCLRLLRKHWNAPQLQLYGRRGEEQHGIDIIDPSGEVPLRTAQCKLKEDGKVLAAGELLREVAKAKKSKLPIDVYLVMTTGKLPRETQDEASKLNRKHKKTGLFEIQLMDWNAIEALIERYRDVYDELLNAIPGSSAVKIEEKLTAIEGSLKLRSPEELTDALHAEIDEAKHLVEQREYQSARVLLNRLRRIRWGQCNPRHKFRVLSNLAASAIGEGNWKEAAQLFLEAKSWQPEDETARLNEALAYQFLGEKERAFELAETLKDAYPHSARAFMILVTNAPSSLSPQWPPKSGQ